MKTRINKFMVFFGVFWSVLTLLFDSFLFVSAVRQVRALTFPSAQGTMISSAVTSHDDSDGTTYGVAMRFQYSVGDRAYEGKRFRYDTSTSSDSAWANAAVAERPPGTKVDVFYNPTNPEDAVLVPGLLGSDLFQMAFLTPFNMVMFGLWAVGWAQVRRNWFKPLAGGVKITTNLRQTRARLTQFSALVSGLATLGLMSFLSIFVIGFFGGGFHPSLRTMLLTWGVILAGSLTVGLWHGGWTLAGKYDLVIDELNGSVELPATCGRKTRLRIPFGAVREVRVETIRQTSSDGEPSMPSHRLTLDVGGAQAGSERLVEWYDAQKAAEFAQWLREQLLRPTTSTRPLCGRISESV